MLPASSADEAPNDDLDRPRFDIAVIGGGVNGCGLFASLADAAAMRHAVTAFTPAMAAPKRHARLAAWHALLATTLSR